MYISLYITDVSSFYALTGQMTYRMTYNQCPLIRRNGIFYFSRRFPADLQQHYRSDRVTGLELALVPTQPVRS